MWCSAAWCGAVWGEGVRLRTGGGEGEGSNKNQTQTTARGNIIASRQVWRTQACTNNCGCSAPAANKASPNLELGSFKQGELVALHTHSVHKEERAQWSARRCFAGQRSQGLTALLAALATPYTCSCSMELAKEGLAPAAAAPGDSGDRAPVALRSTVPPRGEAPSDRKPQARVGRGRGALATSNRLPRGSHDRPS